MRAAPENSRNRFGPIRNLRARPVKSGLHGRFPMDRLHILIAVAGDVLRMKIIQLRLAQLSTEYVRLYTDFIPELGSIDYAKTLP